MKHYFLMYLLFMLVGVKAMAYDFSVDGIAYNITSEVDLTVSVTKKTYSGTVTIPENVSYEGVDYKVTSIESTAFVNCIGLKSVAIPSSVTNIGNQAFYGCSGLMSIIIPESVTSIGDGAFAYCSGLTVLEIPKTVISLGNDCFLGLKCFVFFIAEGEVSFRAHRFLSDDFIIPSSYNYKGKELPVTSIGETCFLNCRDLKSVTIPSSVTSIGDGAFANCTSLTSITIPSSVTSIGVGAFENCTSLTSITIPSSVTSIGVGAFANCTSLTSVTIPSSVTSIGVGAFANCTSLTSVTILSAVTSISKRVFCSCHNLKSVTIPESITSIGEQAFAGCGNLTSVTIPNSVTSIGYEAFAGCSRLRSVTIGKSVSSIDNSFSNCPSIKEVKCFVKQPFNLETTDFHQSIKYAILYVPLGSKSLYEATPVWNEFLSIQEMGPSILQSENGILNAIDYEEANLTLQVTPDAGYVVDVFYVDEEKYLGALVRNSDGTYTLTNLPESSTVSVYFVDIASTATISPVENGTIDVVHFDKADIYFSITPDDNYLLESIIVDDKEMDISSVSICDEGLYCISNLTEGANIQVLFTENKVPTAFLNVTTSLVKKGIYDIAGRNMKTFNLHPSIYILNRKLVRVK